MTRAALHVLLVTAPALALAQAAGAPEPFVRTTLEPPQVVVGQPVTLRIEVLAPNYVTAPPAFPDLQLHNAVTRPLGSANISEQRGGTTYAGVRREVAIHPLEPGAYAIANQKLTVTYAADPPATRRASLPLPPLTFTAIVPGAARGLDPFIAALRLTIEQQVAPVTGTRQAGDAVVRTITLQADGVPAMLLPQVTFDAPEGLAVYPDQPKLAERSDPRSNALTATRVDRATYMLQKPGQYVLPAIDVAWWNVRDHKVEHMRADAITLSVAANPALPQGTTGKDTAGPGGRWRAAAATLLAHWPLLALAIGALAGLAWAAPPAARSARAWLARRHHAYLASEAASFARLRTAVRRGDPRATYAALLEWLARFDPVAPDHTIAALRQEAGDAALDRELTHIEARLYGADRAGAEGPWSPRALLRHVAAARRRLLRRGPATARRSALAPLNPTRPPAQMRARARPVAR